MCGYYVSLENALTCLNGAEPMTTALTASPGFSLAKGLFFDMLSELSSASVMCILPCSPVRHV